MGDNTMRVPAGTPSPYTEIQRRPRSATSLQFIQRPKSATSSSSNAVGSPRPGDKSRVKSAKTPRNKSPNNKNKTKHKPDENEREIKMVSREVRRKLELYMNEEKRQTRFQPTGAVKTTRKMAPFDIAYKLLEYEMSEKESPRNSKSGHENDKKPKRSKDPYIIEPQLVQNSRRVTNYTEAERLSKYASEVFASYPVEQLAVIHRYKPHPLEKKKKGAENGDVLGYSGHVGAALHQKHYVDFYVKEGFNWSSAQESAKAKGPVKKNNTQDEDTKQKQNQKKTSTTSSTSAKNNTANSKQSKGKQNDEEVKKSDDIKNGNVESQSKSQRSPDNKDNSAYDKGDKKKINSSNEGKEDDQQSLASSHLSLPSSTSSDDSSRKQKHNNDKQTKKSEPEGDDKNTRSLTNMSRESYDKNWEYYEKKNVREKDSDEEERNDSGANGDKALTGDSKKDKDTPNTSEGVGKRKDSKGEGDNKSMRSYVSIEHVSEVNVTDI